MTPYLSQNKTITEGFQSPITRYQQPDGQLLVILLVVFLIWPFGAFMLALTHMSRRSSYVIYALWGMLFAWHMNSRLGSGYDDFIGISQRVMETNLTFAELSQQLFDLLTFSDDAPKEWYESFMIWLTHSLSNNFHLYFLLCSIPWLIFELSSLHLITSDRKFRQSLICLIIITLFVLPRDIITLQNPRFTTATWVAVYATICYFSRPRMRHKCIFLLLITPLIHSAFWFYILAFLGCQFLERYPRLTIKLLYISIPFSYFSYDLFTSINISALPLPSIFKVWIGYYLSEETFNEKVLHVGASGFYWVGNLFDFLMKTAYLLIPIYIIRNKAELRQNKRLWRFCGFFIAFYALVSFIQFVPVLGARYFWLVRIYGIYLWFKAIYPRHNRVLLFILFSCSWAIFRRYFYGGAVSVCVPLNIFYEPLPTLIMDSVI